LKPLKAFHTLGFYAAFRQKAAPGSDLIFGFQAKSLFDLLEWERLRMVPPNADNDLRKLPKMRRLPSTFWLSSMFWLSLNSCESSYEILGGDYEAPNGEWNELNFGQGKSELLARGLLRVGA
jgi:hypothetical protein